MSPTEALVVLGTGAIAGLASIPHCASMCGPLAAFACTRRPTRAAPLRYQAGRTLSYTLAGAAAGAFGGVLTAGLSSPWTRAFVSWSIAVALGLAAYRLWTMAGAPKSAGATVALGRSRRGPTLGERLLARTPREPAVFGFLTALLPCGALAAALLVAAGSSSTWGGALVMLGFATTSSLALLGVAWLASRLRKLATPAALRVLAVGLMVGAALMVIRPIDALRGEPDACCDTIHGH